MSLTVHLALVFHVFIAVADGLSWYRPDSAASGRVGSGWVTKSGPVENSAIDWGVHGYAGGGRMNGQRSDDPYT